MSLPRKFLVATDNPEYRSAFETLLSGVRATALWAGSAEQVSGIIGRYDISAVFLDADDAALAAAGLSGELRRAFPRSNCALIMFGGAMEARDLIRWLDGGADDCWKYPFNIPVCRAYLKAVLRRVTLVRPAGGPLSGGGLSLNQLSRQALLNGKALTLRSKEFDLLSLLLSRKGEAMSREVMMNAVWGTDYYGTTRTIDFHISQLRQKLGALGGLIETVPGTGYRFAGR